MDMDCIGTRISCFETQNVKGGLLSIGKLRAVKSVWKRIRSSD